MKIRNFTKLICAIGMMATMSQLALAEDSGSNPNNVVGLTKDLDDGAISFLNAESYVAPDRLAAKQQQNQPNILWLTSEDNGISWVSCYGGKNSKTPAIDQLAKEGFRYTHCFDNAAVCAPTRSTWITGMYAISNGTQPMRSRNNIPHDVIQYYPDLLRQSGYHCINRGKTDYNIGGRLDRACWDKDSTDWQGRQPGGMRLRAACRKSSIEGWDRSSSIQFPKSSWWARCVLGSFTTRTAKLVKLRAHR